MSNTHSAKLAIHERLLPGDTEAERVQAAVALGFSGIEYEAAGLAERVPAITAALDGQPVQACSVHLGWTHNFLHVEEPVRQAALDALRYSFTDAADIGADAVVIVPHIGEDLALPDLMPLKAPMQIAVELMIWHLRSYSDLAYVFGLELYLHPVSPQVSAFLNRLDQGVELRRRIKYNQYVWLAADTYHMELSEDNPFAAGRAHRDSVRLVYLSEIDGSLPGQDHPDPHRFGGIGELLLEDGGWAVMRAYNQDAPPTMDELAASVAHLRKAGW